MCMNYSEMRACLASAHTQHTHCTFDRPPYAAVRKHYIPEEFIDPKRERDRFAKNMRKLERPEDKARG